MPGVRFVVPRSFSYGRPAGPPRFIVIHYTAGSEGPTAAEDGVAYDQRRTDGTSAHFYTDRDSIIQCVDTNDRSHTALRYGNYWGIHIEQCGTVQTRAQWLDPASRETIRNTAKVCAWALKAHGLPLTRLVTSQIRTGKGIGGHKDVTLGFPEDGGTHMDPDGNLPGSYPYSVLLEDIRSIMAGEPAQEDDVELTDTVALDQSPTLNPTGIASRPVGAILGYDHLRTLRTYEAAGRIEAMEIANAVKLDKLLAAAGEEVQRDADEAARDAVELAELRGMRAELAALDPGNTEALREVLSRIRVTVADAENTEPPA
jgi:hypothetical protein